MSLFLAGLKVENGGIKAMQMQIVRLCGKTKTNYSQTKKKGTVKGKGEPLTMLGEK